MDRQPDRARPLQSDGGGRRIPDEKPPTNGGDAIDAFLARADELLEAQETGDAVPSAGSRVGGFRLLHRLGQGGMGVVWLAEDARLNRHVALKILAPHMTFDREAVWRFGQEATAAAALDHSGIVKVYAAGEEAGTRFMAMEYVEGVPLDRLILRLAGRRPHQVTIGDVAAILVNECAEMTAYTANLRLEGGPYTRLAARWTAQTAAALAHAHRKGVLHRDIKPSNLLVDTKGHIRIIDFGLAHVEEAAPITHTGVIIGTVTYMAPEAVAGQREQVDARSDVYSLGTVLYELLTLRPPFVADSLVGLVAEVSTGVPPPVERLHTGVPRDLRHVVAKCMAKEPRHRYANAKDLADDLERFQTGKPVRARPPGVGPRVRQWARRHPVRAFALVLLCVVALAAWPTAHAARRMRAAREAQAERSRARELVARHRTITQEIEEVRTAYKTERNGGLGGRLAPMEERIARLKTERRRVLEQARDALERAASVEAVAGAASPATDAAFAEYYLFCYELALAEEDALAASLARDGVLAYGGEGPWREHLLGRATLRVETAPADAAVYLFRYERIARRGTDPMVPRLLPLPTRGDEIPSAASVAHEFHPADTCLVVTGVEPGSVAQEAGLARGDLVCRIGRTSCETGLFVRSVHPDGAAARRGVRPWHRLLSVDDRSLRWMNQWTDAAADTAMPRRWIRFSTHSFEVDTPLAKTLGVEVCRVDEILEQPAPAEGAELGILRRGRPGVLAIPPGHRAGLTCRLTAYPLVFSAKNRIQPDTALRALPGSYLLVVRLPGFEDQRYPVWIPRRASVSVRVTLLPDGSTPPGCVWIPPGRFRHRPDLLEWSYRVDVTRAGATEIRELREGFFIRVAELTISEWFDFVNAPETIEAIEIARKDGRIIRLPRHYNQPKPFAVPRPDGTYQPIDRPGVPVLGISGEDVVAYVQWYNARARERGEEWLYAIPSGVQWQRAASGADGRTFPWGERLDPSLRLCAAFFPYARTARQGAVPQDESPFGVLDMSGSRREWTDEGTSLHGGSWGDGHPAYFDIWHGDGVGPGYVNYTCGFRPVVVPNVPTR